MNDINSLIIEGEMGSVPNDDGKCYVIVTRTFKNELGEVETKLVETAAAFLGKQMEQ